MCGCCPWVDQYSGNECQYGCAVPKLHSIDDAGKGVCGKEHVSVFSIPVGYALGGFLVDRVFELFMIGQPADSFWAEAFGRGKGAGAAMLFFALGVLGVVTCLVFRRDPHIWKLEQKKRD